MDNELSKTIGERINTLLAKNEVKQKDLAEWTGIKPENTISYFCSGKRMPNTSQLKKIAEYFNTTTDYLLGLSPSPSNEVAYIELTELTGLSDEAIEQLWEEYKGGWRGDNNQANDIMNRFIQEGYLGQLVGEMADYADNLSSHIAYLTEIYQSAYKQYEIYALERMKQLSQIVNDNEVSVDKESIHVFVSDEYRVLNLVALEDVSEYKKNMRLNLFEMSETPKTFATKHFNSLYNQYEDILKKIKELNSKIARYRIEEINNGLIQLNKKKGENNGDDQEEE